MAKRTLIGQRLRERLQERERRAAPANGIASSIEDPSELPEIRRAEEPEHQEQTLPTLAHPALLDTSVPQICHANQCRFIPCSDEESMAYPAYIPPPEYLPMPAYGAVQPYTPVPTEMYPHVLMPLAPEILHSTACFNGVPTLEMSLPLEHKPRPACYNSTAPMGTSVECLSPYDWLLYA